MTKFVDGIEVTCKPDYDPELCCQNAKNYWCSSPKAFVKACPVSCGLCGNGNRHQY